jgi:hypothetical protein
MEELSAMLPAKPIELGDLTSIVQKVAQSTGLAIESQDAGMNMADFRLSRSTGRSLNLMFNKDDDEIMHFTLKSDSEENLGESQFSTFGANREDIQSILEETIRHSGETESDRHLLLTEPLEFKDLEERLLKPAGVPDSWDIQTNEETKEVTLRPVGKPEGPKVTLKIKNGETKQGLMLDDRNTAKLTQNGDHMVAYIGFTNPPDYPKLIEDLKTKLAAFQGRNVAAATPGTSADVKLLVTSIFTDFEVTMIPVGDKDDLLLRISSKDNPKQSVGSVYCKAQLGNEYLEIDLSFFSKIHTIFVKAAEFEAKKGWIENQFKQTIASQATASVGADKIQAILWPVRPRPIRK